MSGHRAHVMCPGAQPQLAIIVPCARCAHRGATQRTLLHAHSECSLLAGEDGQRELGALERMAAITPSSTFDSFDIPNYARLNVPVTTQTSTHRRKQQATQTSLPATPIHAGDIDATERDGMLAKGHRATTTDEDVYHLQVPGGAGGASGSDGDTASLHSITEAVTLDRETWDKKVDFLLSVIGFAVDLANIWRFPYYCFKNGGGVFLIPYLTMTVLAGVPLFYMELALGQYYRQGAITCWGKVCPLFKGIGYCVVLSAFYVDLFYNVIISWALRFFFESLTWNLPWATCNNTWNGPCCYDTKLWAESGMDWTQCIDPAQHNATYGKNCNYSVSPSYEYFNNHFLGYKNKNGSVEWTVDNLGPINWRNLLSLAAVYLICYFSLWKGVKMSGKVVWFTALFPYVVLAVLFLRGVTLPGASMGIQYYLEPKWEKLLVPQVWIDAASQVFFSLGPGFGVLLAFASYNPFHNNIYQDALVTSAVNGMTSFVSGFVIFSVLGYMSCRSGRSIEDMKPEGTSLVFIVYPEALATLGTFAPIFSLIFFMMLLTLGLDSSFGGSEAIITALSDEFPILRHNREIFIAILFTFYFFIGIFECTAGGYIIEEWIGLYGTLFGLIIAVFCESMVISWIYGLERFKHDLYEMLGFFPGPYWCFCWAVMSPAFLLFNFIIGVWEYSPLAIDGVELPEWFQTTGMLMAMSSAAAIPMMAVWQLYIAPGNTFLQKLQASITPWKDTIDSATLHGTRQLTLSTATDEEKHAAQQRHATAAQSVVLSTAKRTAHAHNLDVML